VTRGKRKRKSRDTLEWAAEGTEIAEEGYLGCLGGCLLWPFRAVSALLDRHT